MRKYTFFILFFFIFSYGKTQPPLSASGDKIVDANGKEIQLRGVNLGSWFLIEPYMIAEKEAKSQWQIKRKMIAKGATLKETDGFFESWRNLFIQRADINHIASLGLNNVRMPLHYELFLTPQQRLVRDEIILDSTKANAFLDSLVKWQNQGALFTDENLEGFTRIDSMVAWCKPHGIYITLDLHCAPGGQGKETQTDDGEFPNRFWAGKQARKWQALTTLFWNKIAQRYKAEPLVAMYDILNEPSKVKQLPKLRRFYCITMQSIRKTGDKHLVLVEGGLYGTTFLQLKPGWFRKRGFDNLVYNVHDYSGWSVPKNESQRKLREFRFRFAPYILSEETPAYRFSKKHKVPVYIGEFGESNPAWVSKKVLAYDSLKLSWAFWAYKKIAYNETRCASGIACVNTFDIYNRESREKCLATLQQRKLIFNEDFIKALIGKAILK